MPNSSYPKISIITATFNSAKTLEATIQSVLAQQYLNLEHIIIDGGSTDGTVEIIKKYEQKIAKYVSEKDSGLYDAMNKGIAFSTGEMVAFLNSDDIYVNNPLQSVAATLSEKPAIDVIYANAQVTSDVRPPYIYKSKYPITKNDFWRTPIIHPSMFTKREALERVGRFSTDYRIGADFEIILKLYLAKCTFCYHNTVWASMRGGGLSERNWDRGMFEIFSICRHYNQLNWFITAMLAWCFIKTQVTMSAEKSGFLKNILLIYRKTFRKKYNLERP